LLILALDIYLVGFALLAIGVWVHGYLTNRAEGTIKALAGEGPEPVTYGFMLAIAIFWPVALALIVIGLSLELLKRPI
jgi:hypothetical protein